jgi:hypothetical protein
MPVSDSIMVVRYEADHPLLLTMKGIVQMHESFYLLES